MYCKTLKQYHSSYIALSCESLFQTRLQITVGDTNDNAPIFKEKNYSAKVPENLPINSVIRNISATDADTGQNSIITYQIVGGNEDGKVFITNYVRYFNYLE